MNSCVREKLSDIFTGHGTITLIIIIIVIIIAIIYISLLHYGDNDDDDEEEEKDVDGLSQQYRIATPGWDGFDATPFRFQQRSEPVGRDVPKFDP